ncbi:MAG TPA: hypothetical protein VMC83_33730 [Streptosporangiaceae bacterium]|nr:hypothetical protein [Streptosporangiaceae bacterium]
MVGNGLQTAVTFTEPPPQPAHCRSRFPRPGNRHAAIHGRTAIEISAQAIPTLRVLLWVDTRTYLPPRMVKLDSGATNYPETRKVYDYQFLPASPVNLAKLTLTIPHGYQKTSS